MKKHRIPILLLALMLVIGSSIGALVAYAANVDSNASLKLNQNGDTYGYFIPATTPDKQTAPILVAAIGIDGTIGYVYESDLEEDMPRTPEEAVAYMQKLEVATQNAITKGSEYLRYIPLYDETGTRVIGQFGIGPINGINDSIVE